jgi:hypothetical protein
MQQRGMIATASSGDAYLFEGVGSSKDSMAGIRELNRAKPVF